ncbi:MAG: response regulator [Melioribacteraceae bacterium]|nr:response regulator [Melioribacteraceae bacterium]
MERTKILIIEDDQDVSENISNLLTEFDYNVFNASSGEEGVVLAGKEKPDIIICDIMMKNMDGYKVLEIVTHNPELKGIPFIFLSAKVGREDIRRGMELGADDYLFKPYRASELIKAIETRLAKKKNLLAVKTLNSKAKETDKGEYSYKDRIFLNLHDNPVNLRISEIVCILASNQYTIINTVEKKRILTRKPVTSWLKTLPSKDFIQIHRSTVINSNYIIRMEKWFNNTFRVHLDNFDEPLIISRRFSSKLRNEI